MHFTDFLHNSAREINLEFENFFVKWNKEIEQEMPQLIPLVSRFEEACQGGKRVRGALVKLGFTLPTVTNPLMGGNLNIYAATSGATSGSLDSTNADLDKLQIIHPEILQVSLAYELFETAILAHDDVIDKSPMRRGRASLYTQLGGKHYGISQTICLGDIGFFLAYKLLAECTFDDALKSRAIAFFGQSTTHTVLGELMDVEFGHRKTPETENDILTIYRLKTANYTIVAPLSLGAILGGADEHLLHTIKVYGEHVGIMYQIQDDIKDIFGTPEEIGKERGADIKSGNVTLLYRKAKDRATEQQKELLENIYGNPAIELSEIEAVKKIFVQTGALEYTQSLMTEHGQKAQAIIPKITTDPLLQEMLLEIITYVGKEHKT